MKSDYDLTEKDITRFNCITNVQLYAEKTESVYDLDDQQIIVEESGASSSENETNEDQTDQVYRRLNPEREEGESSQSQDIKFNPFPSEHGLNREDEPFDTNRRRNQPPPKDNPKSIPTDRFVPYEYREKHKDVAATDVLNIDCAGNKEKIIDIWSSQMDMIMLLNEGLKTNLNNAEAFISHKISGNVKAWYENLNINERKVLRQGAVNGHDLLQTFVKVLYFQFCGKDKLVQPAEVLKQTQQEARWHLDNMLLCDICYLDNFYCEYEKYYFKLSRDDYSTYQDIFLNKIQGETGKKIRALWPNRSSEITDTLGGRKAFIDNYIIGLCTQRKELKQLRYKIKDELCCSKWTSNKPGTYGCTKTSKKQTHGKKKKSYDKKSFKKKHFKKYKTIPHNKSSYKKLPFGKQHKKKKFFRKYNPSKYCPQGKQECKCWLCNEDGHYANNCPNRTSKQKELRVLNYVYSIGLMPIENELSSSDEEIYYLTTDYESSSDESSTESD